MMDKIRQSTSNRPTPAGREPVKTLRNQSDAGAKSLSELPPFTPVEMPRTLRSAADALGVGYHVIQRAARRGLVPTYRLGTSRPYVKLSDFIALMNR